MRYVLEYAFTRYFGDQPSLGFNNLHSIGASLKLDSSAHDIFITRTRLVGRYRFGGRTVNALCCTRPITPELSIPAMPTR